MTILWQRLRGAARQTRDHDAARACRRRILPVLGAVAFACMPQSQVEVPQVASASTLNIDALDVTQPAPFALVHAAPKGPTTGDPSIHLVFSKPMKPLGPDVPVPEGLQITPPVSGHWEWVGSQGLTFVPEAGTLRRSTRYRVHVPETLTDLSGSRLPVAVDFEFDTPLARVRALAPSRWGRPKRPDTEILLRFTQPVSIERLVPFVFAKVGGKELELRLQLGKEPGVVRVTAVAGWPLASTVEYGVQAGFPSEDGELPAAQSLSEQFKTYGPLIANVECERDARRHCRPEGNLSLSLSNPVNARMLAQAVRATGGNLHVDRNWSPESTTQHISLGARLKPREQFTVNVKPVVDIYGQPLRFVRDRQVAVADLRSRVRVGFGGTTLPTSESSVAVLATNASYELAVARLSEESLAAYHQLKRKGRFTFAASLSGAQVRPVARGALNRTARELIDLDRVTPSGPFLIGVRYQGEDGPQEDVRWGQRTDLSLTVKAGREQTWAWATHLRTGAPLAGAALRVVGSKGSATTDAQGVASLPAGEFLTRAGGRGAMEWLQVRSGDQVAYRSNREAMDGWRHDVPTDYYGEQRDLAFLFPERDLFRPGEQAWLKAYVRRPVVAGNVVLAGEALQLVLLSPDGEVSQRLPVKSNQYGSLAARLSIPQSGQLGYWSAELHRGKQVLASTVLQVAEFRPAEFTVKASAKESSVLAGGSMQWGITGSYFYGGVMGLAKVETVVSRRPAHFAPRNLDSYDVGDAVWQSNEPYVSYSSLLHSESAKLDTLGELKLSTAAKLPHQVGPERVELEATVTDLSGQTASARGSVLVHPAGHYLAIKHLESTLVDAPSSLAPLVRAVTPEGQSVPGRTVHMALFRARWTHVKRRAGTDSSQTVREYRRDLVSRCSFTTAAVDRGCELTVREPGEHVLRAATVDDQGRNVFTSSRFYAVGSGGGAWRDSDEQRTLQLTLDRKVYEPGQSARILIQSPFQRARAWITIEKDGVLSQRIVQANGSSPTVRVPITERMRPNAYVSVHLVEDRAALGKKAHSISESYRTGYAELRLNPERRRLSVSAQPKRAAYRPGDTVEIGLQVKDSAGAGRQAEVTVFVVDEGVLTLSGYELPDPLGVFTGPRPLRVATTEGREFTARLFGLEPNQNEKKGNPGGGGGNDRAALLTTAYFNPSIETDRGGQARVKFKLPDNLGRFRIMALAATTDDRYGRGQSSFDVNRRLMVRPALPRMLRSGDEVELSAVVSALGFAGGEVRVQASASGLELLEAGSQTLTMDPNGSKLVTFRAKAPKVGAAKIRFSVAGQGETDSVVSQRKVQSPAQLEAVALYGKTTSAEGHQLGDLSAVRRDMGGLDVTLSSSALVGLQGGFEQLWDYPYQCSEQLSSRLLPLILLKDMAELYGVTPPRDAESRIKKTLALLVRRQRGDGGFGMWPESAKSSPFVSAYALWVLHEAKERGRPVPDAVFERGARYLQDLAAKRTDEALPDAVFASFALSKIGKGDKNTQNALFEHVEQMPVESQLMLLWAAVSSGGSALVEPLLRRAEGAITLRGNAAEITRPHGPDSVQRFSSDTRRHAVSLSALLAAKPAHALGAPLVRTLLQARQGGSWGSTQESAFALLALDAYRRAQEKVEPEFNALVFLGRKLLGQKRFVGRSSQAQSFSVEMARLAGDGDLVFQREGAGTLFFEARLKYARQALPTEGLESGFLVQKTISPMAAGSGDSVGPALDTNHVSHGSLVLVELTVLTPGRRRFVVVDDPLPAGLEALDMSLDNTQRSLTKHLKAGDGGYAHAWYRSEMRDDRVLFFVDDMPSGVYRYRYLARATNRGAFVTPPTRALEMYQEEVYGRTAARKFLVQ